MVLCFDKKTFLNIARNFSVAGVALPSAFAIVDFGNKIAAVHDTDNLHRPHILTASVEIVKALANVLAHEVSHFGADCVCCSLHNLGALPGLGV